LHRQLSQHLCSKNIHLLPGEHGEIWGRLEVGQEKVACWSTIAAISFKRIKMEEKLVWRACRNLLMLFRMVRTVPTPYGLLFQRLGVHNPHSKLQSLLSQEWDFFVIFTAQCTLVQSAVLRLHVVRLRPSVRPSVTLVDLDHISGKSWKLIARTLSPTPSLFVALRSSTYSQGYMEKFWGD